MKRVFTISIALLLCCFFSCDKRTGEKVFAPLETGLASEDSFLINKADSLERVVLSEIYYANMILAKKARVVIARPMPNPIRASDAVNE